MTLTLLKGNHEGIAREAEGELELCVSCWNFTDVRKDKPIELRSFYVEGVGQLCSGCGIEFYRQNRIDPYAIDGEREVGDVVFTTIYEPGPIDTFRKHGWKGLLGWLSEAF